MHKISDICWFVNDVLHTREIRKGLFWRAPVERSHGEMIIGSFTNSQLFLEVLERVETVRSIEFFIILAVAAFNLAVMSGRVRSDQLVPNTKLCQLSLKCSRRVISVWQ